MAFLLGFGDLKNDRITANISMPAPRDSHGVGQYMIQLEEWLRPRWLTFGTIDKLGEVEVLRVRELVANLKAAVLAEARKAEEMLALRAKYLELLRMGTIKKGDYILLHHVHGLMFKADTEEEVTKFQVQQDTRIFPNDCMLIHVENPPLEI